MRETEQIEMPLLLVLVPRMVATCFLLLLVLLLALRPVPEQLSKQHSTKHGALMLEGRGFGRPLRALTCSYNEDTTAASWRAIQVARRLAKPVQDWLFTTKSTVHVLIPPIRRNK